VIVVPPQAPLLLQTSLYVQASPSLHAVPVFGVTVQLAVPLHVRVLHSSLVQVIEVPPQIPLLLQTSS